VLRPNGILIVVDFAPHALEFLRDEHAHRRLGFADPDVDEWCRAAGLDPSPAHRLPGDPLTVVIWTAHRQAVPNRLPDQPPDHLLATRPAAAAARVERIPG
jgi:ArsR family transcriptional regulator